MPCQLDIPECLGFAQYGIRNSTKKRVKIRSRFEVLSCSKLACRSLRLLLLEFALAIAIPSLKEGGRNVNVTVTSRLFDFQLDAIQFKKQSCGNKTWGSLVSKCPYLYVGWWLQRSWGTPNVYANSNRKFAFLSAIRCGPKRFLNSTVIIRTFPIATTITE